MALTGTSTWIQKKLEYDSTLELLSEGLLGVDWSIRVTLALTCTVCAKSFIAISNYTITKLVPVTSNTVFIYRLYRRSLSFSGASVSE